MTVQCGKLLLIDITFDVNRKVSPTDGAVPFPGHMAQGQEVKQSSPSGKLCGQSWED